jgi:flagellar assembly protein FliH
MTRIIPADRDGARIIPAVIVDAQTRAALILAEAHSEASAMRAAARAACEGLAERAKLEARELATAEARAQLSSALEELASARQQWLEGLPLQLIELAMEAARHIVGAKLDVQPDTFESIVRPLLDRLRRAQRILLHLHPDDERWLRTALPRLQRDLNERAELQLQSDPAIMRGGCLLVSDIGAIDARLETRLERLAGAVRQATRPDAD